LGLSQADLSVPFYDMAADHPRESFEMITKRVISKEFGKVKNERYFQKRSASNILSRSLKHAGFGHAQDCSATF